MGGFNAQKFVEEFKIEDRYIPVMLISVEKRLKTLASDGLPLNKATTWN